MRNVDRCFLTLDPLNALATILYDDELALLSSQMHTVYVLVYDILSVQYVV